MNNFIKANSLYGSIKAIPGVHEKQHLHNDLVSNQLPFII